MDDQLIKKEIESALPDRPLLRVDEVMNILQCSKKKVYRLFENDDLGGTKIGGSLRIFRTSVIKLIFRNIEYESVIYSIEKEKKVITFQDAHE